MQMSKTLSVIAAVFLFTIANQPGTTFAQVKKITPLIEGGYVPYTGPQIPYLPPSGPSPTPVYNGLGPNGLPLPVSFPPLPKAIAGKPYSVTPGETPGTYVVKWGDESMLWKPTVWMEPEQIKMGPAYLAQWIAPGLPKPWDIPIEKRDKLAGADYWTRGWNDSFYNIQIESGQDSWVTDIVLPNGELRTHTDDLEAFASFEGGHAKKFLPSGQGDKLNRYYGWAITSPDELRNQAGITSFFYDMNLIPEDLLYLPQVRRTRRLAGAVAKEYFPGMTCRYEDVEFTQALPQLNYKLLGFKLFTAPTDLPGFGSDHPDVKAVSDAGDVIAIVEITPKPGVEWWYAKRLVYIGLMSMEVVNAEAYDKNGTLTNVISRSLIDGNNEKDHLYTEDGPKPPSWYTIWGRWFIYDTLGGFSSYVYSTKIVYDSKTVPPDFFTASTLAKQPSSFAEWLSGE